MTELANTNLDRHVDVAIVGGGPVGAALLLALRDSGLAVALLEARPVMAARDPRALALAHGTRLILERLGAWSTLTDKATPIESIHVSQRGGFGRAVLTAAEAGVPALGYTAEYGDLYAALAARVSLAEDDVVLGAQVTAVRPAGGCGLVEYILNGQPATLSARLIVLADGGKSLPAAKTSVKDYGQSAVICTVRTELPHARRAYERFTPKGPIALLPLGDDYALVWTTQNDLLESRMALSDAAFMADLQDAFGDRQGRFVAAGARSAFPLRLITTAPEERAGLVRIGNAAQTLHPVAGQGFNLGLRDAWWLAETLMDATPEQFGDTDFMQRYRKRRRWDVGGGIAMTDLLVEAFANDLPGLGLMRGLGLSAMDGLPPLKTMFARKMMFGAQSW
ncbi:MAG: FAD-dependent monooxygenase [Hydrogenophilales bacterium]|nr:FAD-dependent monooxygenase [Hydrogenophilales bacterium]